MVPLQMIQEDLTQFIVENFLFGRQEGLTADDSFLEKGILDSTSILELILHLERTYGFAVEDSDLIPGNLDSINRLTAFVERKRRTV
jgi:acyl carrier protein